MKLSCYADQKRKRNVLKDEIRLWPNGRVPYRISTELYNNVTIRENIAAAMLEISKVSCVRFENNQANDVERLDIIRAKSKQNPCLSNIGRQPGKPTVFDKFNIIKERVSFIEKMPLHSTTFVR